MTIPAPSRARLVTVNVASTGTWYGMGWLVNTAGNWWHTGGIPGTATEEVHAANGFGWAAFFNSQPANADFYTDLDTDLWTAFNGTSSFGSIDLFDQ
jgi:D-alanyl-D-alanine carboxypeptidase